MLHVILYVSVTADLKVSVPAVCVNVWSAAGCMDTAVAVPSLTDDAGKYTHRASSLSSSPAGLPPSLKEF